MMRLLLVWFLFPALISAQDLCGTLYDSTVYNFPMNRVLSDWKDINVVVHVCWSDSFPDSYFSEAYVEQAIDLLNDDMYEASIGINLVGIDYTDLMDYAWHDAYVSNDNWCFPNYGTQNTMLANDLSWDTSDYCNIYILPKMCGGILGWSYVTSSPYNARDGIWIHYAAFGVGSDHLRPNNNLNKVVTHEMGHYCGLHHVFQNVGNCGDDDGVPCDVWGDFVCDTPPTKVQFSCDPPMCPEDWYDYTADNHMDYYPDLCREHFTPGQIERMHNMLEYQRSSLFGGYEFCLGDINGDYVVGATDLVILLSCWGTYGCLDGDINNSGYVNIDDLQFILALYGNFCEGHPLWE